jgi:hypothetical protein
VPLVMHRVLPSKKAYIVDPVCRTAVLNFQKVLNRPPSL